MVTLCGHLYCWPCLYRWLQVQNHSRTCPVCKAGVDRDKVIPIYGRGGNEDPRGKSKGGAEVVDVPSRPAGQRPAPVLRNAMMAPNAANAAAGPQGLGIIQTLFGLQGPAGQGGYAEPLTPEQQHQAFLSRLLLMLGSFVIMCCEWRRRHAHARPAPRKCLCTVSRAVLAAGAARLTPAAAPRCPRSAAVLSPINSYRMDFPGANHTLPTSPSRRLRCPRRRLHLSVYHFLPRVAACAAATISPSSPAAPVAPNPPFQAT